MGTIRTHIITRGTIAGRAMSRDGWRWKVWGLVKILAAVPESKALIRVTGFSAVLLINKSKILQEKYE